MVSAACSRCGEDVESVFWLPGAWDGGICAGCGQSIAAFREHFGEVRFVSDGDAGAGHAKS